MNNSSNTLLLEIAAIVAVAISLPAQAAPSLKFAVSVDNRPAVTLNHIAVDSIADQNGDLVRDFLVGMPELSRVQLRSGVDGTLISTLNGPPNTDFGHDVAAIGDISGDGVEDVLIGAPKDGNGRAYVFRFQNFAFVQIRSWQHSQGGPQSSHRYGSSVNRCGDLTGDGIEEIAVTAPRFSTVNPSNRSGMVEIRNPVMNPPQLLFAAVGNPGDELGTAVVPIGSVDGDGIPDIAVGASRQFGNGGTTFPGTQPGMVRILRGSSSGAGVIWTDLFGFAPFDAYGWSLGTQPNFTTHPAPEVIVGASFTTTSGGLPISGRAVVHASDVLALPASVPIQNILNPGVGNSNFGWSVSGGVGDHSGDAIPEMLVGAPWVLSAAAGPGHAYLISMNGGGVVHDLSPAGASATFGYDVSEHRGLRFLVADPGAKKVFMY